ncbi:MAG: response regulator transcription factor [Lacisediminihabitans sp.]
MRILIVEDDVEFGALLARWLGRQGYEAEVVTNGMDGLIAFSNSSFAAAAIDVMLPGMSGFELCRRIRDTGSRMPLILLTARDAVQDRVYGLDAGADDYLTKPFAFAELGARLRALLRRDAAVVRTSLTVANIELDSMMMRATVQGRRVAMSLKEFALLRLLAAQPGYPVSRSRILEEVWGSAEHIDPNILEQYISFLRRKLDPQTAGVQIVTIRGTGYLLEVLA